MPVTWAQVDSFVGNKTVPELVTHRPCPVCGAVDARTVLELTDFQFYTDSATEPKRVTIRQSQCKRCFALYLNPCYSEYGFRTLFAEAGQSYGSSDGRSAEQTNWLNSRGLLGEGATILDAGCYDGRFLAQLPNGLTKIGVDIDGPAIELGRRLYGEQGIQFVLGDFETFGSPDAPDTITMFHVLEHLPRPVEVLKNLRRNAHERTELIVEVPILERGATNDVNGFLSVQHMTHFSRRSLANCFALGGWRIVETTDQEGYNGLRVRALPAADAGAFVPGTEDVQLLYGYLAAWYQGVSRVNERLAEFPDLPRCVIWGGGAHTEFMYQMSSLFNQAEAREYLLVDSDPLKQGKTWRGISIAVPDVLSEIDWRDTWLLVSSYGSQEAIFAGARARGVPVDRIATIYERVNRY